VCVAVLRKAFDAFDREKSGSISTNMVEEILRLMGQPFNRNTLEELIDEVDADSKHEMLAMPSDIGLWKFHTLSEKHKSALIHISVVNCSCNTKE